MLLVSTAKWKGTCPQWSILRPNGGSYIIGKGKSHLVDPISNLQPLPTLPIESHFRSYCDFCPRLAELGFYLWRLFIVFFVHRENLQGCFWCLPDPQLSWESLIHRAVLGLMLMDQFVSLRGCFASLSLSMFLKS